MGKESQEFKKVLEMIMNMESHRAILKKVPNWKAPRHDGIHGFMVLKIHVHTQQMKKSKPTNTWEQWKQTSSKKNRNERKTKKKKSILDERENLSRLSSTARILSNR